MADEGRWQKAFFGENGPVTVNKFTTTKWWQPPLKVLLIPFRRELTADWLAPVLRVGTTGADEHVIGPRATIIEPQHDGELFFYVNDVVLGIPYWYDIFYRGNVGKGRLVIAPIAAVPSGDIIHPPTLERDKAHER
jgi:hypothetical protein